LYEKDLEMLMLAEKGDRLRINKHMSQRVSFAVSDTKYSHQALFKGQQLLTPNAFRVDGEMRDLA
jgi:hypothetical protein